MKTKIAYAVFAKTETGKDYMVKSNFGNDRDAAEKWAKTASPVYNAVTNSYEKSKYFVKKINY